MRWWDIDAVLELERDLFPQDAWSRGMFWSELAHARGHGASRHYVVAEAGGRLLGYGGLAVSADLADVQTIAVVREQWGTGLGARLLTDLLRYATAAECAEVMLEVRVDNTRAQRLYERFGFAPVGFRRGYYQPGNVDALVMRLIPGAPDDAGPAQPVPGPEQPAVPRPATSREGSRGPAGATDSSAASFPVTHAATPEAGTAAAEERPGHEQPQREKPPQELRVPEHHGPEQQGPETHG
jgi:ribosomal-protein-alanine N-acetyltransferase